MTPWRGTLSLWLVLTRLLVLPPAALSTGSFAMNLAAMFACTEDFPFFASRLPWDCQQYMVCHGGDVIIQRCPSGMVFNQVSLLCDWPTSREVRRCYKNMEGYARASCHPHKSLVLPNPDSCALFLDCKPAPSRQAGQEREVTHNHVQECPYPSLFSPAFGRCADFRQVEHQCRGRPVPKAPCDYLQYRQLTSSSRACHRRHPSCVNMRNGFHPVALTRPFTLYAKQCFRERTVDIISCSGQPSSPVFSNGNRSCVRHLYDASQRFCSINF